MLSQCFEKDNLSWHFFRQKISFRQVFFMNIDMNIDMKLSSMLFIVNLFCLYFIILVVTTIRGNYRKVKLLSY